MDTTSNALEEMRRLEQEYEERKRAIQDAAVRELAKAIAAKKQELQELEEQYSRLTGKTLRGDRTPVRRRRLSAEETRAMQERIANYLREHPQGAKMKDIVAALGEATSVVRRAIHGMSNVESHGVKAATVYRLNG